MTKNEFSYEKILGHPTKLGCFQKDINFAPVSMEFSISNDCNNNCVWCNDRKVRGLYDGFLEFDIIKQALVNMKSYGVKAVTFEGGGEPTMHPNFSEVIEFAKGLDFDIGIITNGTLINEPLAKVIAGCCKWCRVSLDAGSKRSYNFLHKNNAFDAVIDGLRFMIKYREGDFKVGVSYIVHEDNSHECFNCAKLLEKIGVDYVQFKPLITNGVFEPFDKERMDNINTQLANTAFKVYVSGSNATKQCYDFCHAHRFSGQIDAQGNVNLCCNLGYRQQLNFGNLHDESFIEIWKGKKRQEVINKVEQLGFKDKCPVCRFHSTNFLLNKIKKENNNFI